MKKCCSYQIINPCRHINCPSVPYLNCIPIPPPHKCLLNLRSVTMLKLPLLVTLCVLLSTTSVLSHKNSPHPSRADPSGSSTDPSGPQGRKWHRTPELKADYWTKMAKNIVKNQKDTENKRKAKNVIMFLGDGMGIQTVTAARMLLGDENQKLAFEKFRHSGLSKTYCVTSQIADSACTATAYLTGVKTNDGMVGINAKVPYGDCVGTNDESAYTYSIAKWAQVAGKSTGLVTTTRVTHASPAGVYAHSAHRDWESDFSLSAHCDPSTVKDIAQQLVRGDVGSNLNVILGGGRREFMNNTVRDAQGVQGLRRDGRDLLSEWLNDGKRRKQLVKTRAQLQSVDTSRTDYLMGLFAGSDLKFFLEGDKTQPTLWEMTKKALEVLRKNKNGFFLFVEGGRIDHGHHGNQAKLALTEAVQFSEAIEKTREMFSEKDTLIVTTADHSHVMSISGYPVSKCYC